jgi:hypothetical protein
MFSQATSLLAKAPRCLGVILMHMIAFVSDWKGPGHNVEILYFSKDTGNIEHNLHDFIHLLNS